VAAAEEEEVILVKHQLQILNHILQTGDEVEGVSAVEGGVEVEEILKLLSFGIDTLILELELLRTFVVVVVVEALKNYDRMPL
jgi:hypothetical protein